MYEYYGSRFFMRSGFIYEHYCPISLYDLSPLELLFYLFLYAVRSHTRVLSLFLYAVRSHVRVCYPCVFLLPCIVAESVQTCEY